MAIVVLCAVAALLAGAGSAGARVLEGEISETEPGESLESPHGLAVDSTDHLWVTDRILVGGEVHKYSPTGTWETQTAPPPWNNHHMLETIAFDEAAGRIFVSDSNVDSLWALDPADASYAGIELKPLGETTCCFIRVAADNSGGLYDGALYVFSSEGKIVRIDSGGNPVDYTEGTSAGTNELSGADTPSGFFDGPHGLSGGGIAVDAVGHLWVADTPGPPGPQGAIHEFAPSGRYLRTITNAAPAEALTEINAVAIDPTSGNVLVSDVGVNKIHEFTPAGAFVATTPILMGGAPVGLAVDSTGKLYVSGAFGPEPGETVIDVFGAAGPPAGEHALEIEVTGAGEVLGAGIACAEAGNGTACEEEFVEGSEVPLVVAPAAGNRFAGWTAVEGDAGSCTGAAASCEAGPLTEATKLEALFVPTQDLEVTVTGAGEVNSSPAGIGACGTPTGSCLASYDQGAVVTLTASPAVGSAFAGWSGGGCSGTGTCQVTMGADTEVTARFDKLPPPPPPAPEEVEPVPARLRIDHVRSKAGREKARIVVVGSIAKQAHGTVTVTVKTKLEMRKVSTSKRVRIAGGRWRARLALEADPGAKVLVTARFSGSPEVTGDRARRRFTLE